MVTKSESYCKSTFLTEHQTTSQTLLAAFAYRRAENVSTGLVDTGLSFLRMPPLLAAVVAALCFCGRSLGLSVAATTITSNQVPLWRSFFLPGRGDSGTLTTCASTLCTIRQTAASERCHDTAICIEGRYSRVCEIVWY
jgi:hypothetical protein